MGWVLLCLAILGYLQVRLWYGKSSLQEVVHLSDILTIQARELGGLEQRNHKLSQEVALLKETPRAMEERARGELGMIKDHETFYLVVDGGVH
jgi:cell division protein FtsB